MASELKSKKAYPELAGYYRIGKTIGCGGFAKVKLANHLLTGELVAIKIMDKAALKSDLPRVSQEIEALKCLNHRNICSLYEVIESDEFVYLVMEYCCGGELFDYIVEKDKLSEDESRRFFRQIVEAVAYCHKLGFIHRDLKPENILLDSEENLKIVDFGLCIRPVKDNCLETSCGSPSYAAPEVIRGEKYVGAQADIWSLGVLLYALLCGCLPFEDSTLEKLYQKVQRGIYYEHDFLSKGSRAILKEMLQVDPRRRINTDQLRQHPWLRSGDLEEIVVIKDGKTLPRDNDCLDIMSQFHGRCPEKMWTDLKKLNFNHDNATYRILLDLKRRRQPLRKLRRPLLSVNSSSGSESNVPVNAATFVVADNTACKQLRTNVLNRKRICDSTVEDEGPTPKKRTAVAGPTMAETFVVADRSSTNQRRAGTRSRKHTGGSTIEEHVVKNRTDAADQQHVVSSTASTNIEDANAPQVSTRRGSTPFDSKRGGSLLRKRIRSPGLDDNSSGPKNPKLSTIGTTPMKAETKTTPKIDTARRRTPLSARKMLHGLERGLRSVFTPRKSFGRDQSPVYLTATQMSNVSSTNSNDPDKLVALLRNALLERGISCKQNGHLLQGKLKRPGVTDDQKSCKLSFELEVCWVPKTSQRSRRSRDNSRDFVVGIRRKRLKGDAWIYKTVCEEVLAVAAAS